MHKSIPTTLLVVALSGVGATTASADSIAYIKGGDVWLTQVDGSRQFQVTTGGGYNHVSQADDGTLLATSGGQLRRLDRYGSILSDIATPVSTSGTSLFSFYGPFDADISPNGKTVAYGWWSKGYQNNSTGAIDYEEHNGHGFTKPDALTGFTDAGYKYAKDWDAPEWIDDSTVLLGNGPGYPSDPFAIETVGSGDPQGWFTDPGNMHPLEPTISRNKRVIAAVVGPGRQGLRVYRDWDAQLLGNTSTCFTYNGAASDQFESPTLNADGSMLAFSTGHSLEVAAIGDMSTTCAPGKNSTTIVDGATSPDWGPADVPTSRPVSPAPAVPGGGAGAGPSGSNSTGGSVGGSSVANTGGVGTQTPPANGASGGATGSTGALRIDVTKRKLKLVVKRGLPLTIHGVPGRVVISATAGTNVVGGATAKIGPNGTAGVTLKFTRKAARRYRVAHAVTLSITATQGSQIATASARL